MQWCVCVCVEGYMRLKSLVDKNRETYFAVK
jgi:hypothetical protein